jgi:site-specific DNA-methyltransferase (adenine-specific)
MTDRPRRARTPTATSSFGSSRRENHDASAFYARFDGPTVSADATVVASPLRDRLVAGDSRTMDELPDGCIALVVTSPPYFSAKQYEEAMGRATSPAPTSSTSTWSTTSWSSACGCSSPVGASP